VISGKCDIRIFNALAGDFDCNESPEARQGPYPSHVDRTDRRHLGTIDFHHVDESVAEFL
jgi:hypothetical protein